MSAILFVILSLATICLSETVEEVPEYIKQCHEEDPQLIECFKQSLQHLKPYLASGVPEIELPTIEPFVLDELSLSLATGARPFKVSLNDIDVHGASNFTVEAIKLSEGDQPFEATVKIAQLRMTAKYTSSGVLIILPATGKGTFYGTFDDITAYVKGKISVQERDQKKYLHVDRLTFTLDMKKVKMHVLEIFNNNRLLIEATNVFLRENGHEMIEAMSPQLTKKLSSLFKKISNNLLKNVSVDTFLIPAKH